MSVWGGGKEKTSINFLFDRSCCVFAAPAFLISSVNACKTWDIDPPNYRSHRKFKFYYMICPFVSSTEGGLAPIWSLVLVKVCRLLKGCVFPQISSVTFLMI
jgi:hypothetical protein